MTARIQVQPIDLYGSDADEKPRRRPDGPLSAREIQPEISAVSANTCTDDVCNTSGDVIEA